MQVNTSAIGAITPYSKHSFLVKFSFMRSFAMMSKNSFIILLFKFCIIQIPVLHYSKLHFGLFRMEATSDNLPYLFLCTICPHRFMAYESGKIFPDFFLCNCHIFEIF
jgi:hypothetical protein